MSTFFLLLSTPLLLLFNVEVPPFLVSCAIAFSYMYFCIWKVPVSVQYPTPVVCHALKIRAPARSLEVNLMLLFTKQLKCVQLKRIRLRPECWTDPRSGLKKEKFAALEMNGKPAPSYRSWFKHLKPVRFVVRIHRCSCYINPSSPPPCSLRVPPSSTHFSLQAVGNRLHRSMENFLKLEESCQSPPELQPPTGYARHDRRAVTIVPGPLSFIKPTFTRPNSPQERRKINK